jgi:hypothetical protein
VAHADAVRVASQPQMKEESVFSEFSKAAVGSASAWTPEAGVAASKALSAAASVSAPASSTVDGSAGLSSVAKEFKPTGVTYPVPAPPSSGITPAPIPVSAPAPAPAPAPTTADGSAGLSSVAKEFRPTGVAHAMPICTPVSGAASHAVSAPTPGSASVGDTFQPSVPPGSFAAAVASKLASSAKEWKPSVAPTTTTVSAVAPPFVPSIGMGPTADGAGLEGSSDDDFSPDELAMLDAEALRQDMMAIGTRLLCVPEPGSEIIVGLSGIHDNEEIEEIFQDWAEGLAPEMEDLPDDELPPSS